MQEAKILSKLQVGLMISRTMQWVSGITGISMTSLKIHRAFMWYWVKIRVSTRASKQLKELFQNFQWTMIWSLKTLLVFQFNKQLWWDFWSTSLVICINLCTTSTCITTLTLLVILVETRRKSCFSITPWWSSTLISTAVLFVLTLSTVLST